MTLENGKIPSTQLPSYVDDTPEGVLSGGNFLVGEVAVIPEAGKIYVDTETNLPISLEWKHICRNITFVGFGR